MQYPLSTHICPTERRQGPASGSRAPLVPLKAKMSLSQGDVEPLAFRVPRDYPHSRFNKAPLAVYPPKGARSKAWLVLSTTLKIYIATGTLMIAIH